jgi:uncharacterized membrane-anchored protein YhcB (DUF1043 family)
MNKMKMIVAVIALMVGVYLIFWSWRNTSLKTAREQQLAQEIEAYKVRNDDAIGRLEARIKDTINLHRKKIPDFVEDATDYGTKVKLIYKGSSDLANKLKGRDKKAIEVQGYMTRMFEMYFFSGDTLNRAVENQTHQFGEDMDASRKVLYANLLAQWNQDPDIRKKLNLDAFIADSNLLLKNELNKNGITLVSSSMGAVVGSELIAMAGTYIAQQLFTAIAAQAAASSATAAATAGGATTAGAGGGAVVGTPCGAPCMLVGAAVGMALGLAVDWVLTDRMCDKLTTMLNKYFDDIESALINGTDREDGVVEFYRKLTHELEKKEQEAIAAKLQGIK